MTMIRAVWRGRILAESKRTVEAGGYRYFPRDAVRMDMLRPAPQTDSDRECPHRVQFYDVVDGGARSARAAWSYEAPRGSLQRVAHWIGFWEDIEIAPADRRR